MDEADLGAIVAEAFDPFGEQTGKNDRQQPPLIPQRNRLLARDRATWPHGQTQHLGDGRSHHETYAVHPAVNLAFLHGIGSQ